MDAIESEVYRGYTINIYPDEDAVNPVRDYSPFKYYCRHRKYDLGNTDTPPGEDDIVLPLYLYDHSGITIATVPFSCPWDSGQVGWVYTGRHNAFTSLGEFSEDDVREQLRNDVANYDLYLTGQVYGYEITDPDDECNDSCWGFVGDPDYVYSQARSAVDRCIADRTRRHLEQVKGWIKHAVPLNKRKTREVK